MARNLFSPYGRFGRIQLEGAKNFLVSPSGTAQYADILERYPVDEDGVPRVYTTVTAALANCVTGRADHIFLTNDFTTVLTAAELLSVENKGVTIIPLSPMTFGWNEFTAYRATAALPASTQGSIFTVTGNVRLIGIKGEVTSTIQTQTCNLKITANPTVGADVDICSNLDVTAKAVGTTFSITGTLATALVSSTSGAYVFQAAPVVIQAGTLDLVTGATNTGSVKWQVIYLPMDQGARMIAA